MCSHINDVVVIAQLTSFSTEPQIRSLGQFDCFGLETFTPLVWAFILQVYAQRTFCVVRQSNLCGYGAPSADSTSLQNDISSHSNELRRS